MKQKATDAQVQEYVKRLKAGQKSESVFPAKMSECDFSDSQRDVIRKARAERKAAITKLKKEALPEVEKKEPVPAPAKARVLGKLAKMLYLQSGRCFFCGEPLSESDASIEHLQPKSRGGKSEEENEVVCHASLNDTFGSMGLKSKFEFVLKSAGIFKCPR